MHSIVAALALVLTGSVVPPLPDAAGGPTCQGVAATIVGEPGGRVVGTSGPDVVVTNGATEVMAGDGDDLVCATASSARDSISVVLGAGDDTYVGGRAREYVDARDEGHDTVRTGGGNDSVVTGSASGPDQDVIDAGASGDHVIVNGIVGPAARLSGGDGRDMLIATIPSSGRWVFDNRAGEVRHDGASAWRFGGIERFQLGQIRAVGRISFIGGPDDDLLIATTASFTGARLGGGQDTLYLGSPRLRRLTPLDGGAGRDRLLLMPHGIERPVPHAELDLGRGSLSYVDRSGRRSDLTVRGFESVDVHAGSARLTGSAGPDTLTAWSCDVTVSAGGGNDRLGVLPERRCGPASARLLAGGPGDDRLTGTFYDDTLLGGPGRDRADGLGGRDRCQAEEPRRCEVSVP